MIDLAEACMFAQAMAREAGEIMLRDQERLLLDQSMIHLKGKNDVVTDTDVEIETIIAKRISTVYPDHSIWGEEHGKTSLQRTSSYTWIIDPIDGTANFAVGIRCYCVSIALSHASADGRHEELSVGVIYDPQQSELFAAVKGGGATLNGRAIHPSATKKLSEAIVGFDAGPQDAVNLQKMLSLCPKVRKFRVLGSVVLEMVYVATGRLDAFFNCNQLLHPWDAAAALLICLEAGAIATTFDGSPASFRRSDMTIAAPGIYKEFAEALQQTEERMKSHE